MHLMYTLDDEGKRVYTLKKVTPGGKITRSAHPESHARRQDNQVCAPCSVLSGRQVCETSCYDQKAVWNSAHAAAGKTNVTRENLLVASKAPGGILDGHFLFTIPCCTFI
ncbi:unnamed protein product [Rhizoctonia solani]|uniref:H/ACA ribonucleoprotein complex subunit NOP10 n=1 Tax=Rhizoctonia solani TaxID=456999 RepID=A0A8H3BDF8_9AGAM|nr:unnamed protein product [Rhizoctonia solani]